MKRILALLALLVAAVPVLTAQEPSPAKPGRLQVAPAAASSAPMPAAEPEVTLIPEQVPQNVKPAPAPQPEEKKSKTEQSAEELMERIHFREAKVKAERDPKVQAEWESATKAKTDYDKREALKRYYTLLYSRILKLDGSVRKTAELRQAAALRRLQQTRIDPTEPLDDEERAERAARSE
ncbi:MAG: hypothetical protein WCF18_09275 [Chthoniobacteraceae bacterium]